jgi:hypothetical protein
MEILPDSRCKTPIETVMGDFEFPDGRVARIEWEMAYCIFCHKPYAWVPKDNTTSVGCMCMRCFADHGHEVPVGMSVQPDHQFCLDVAAEMQDRYGRTLTDEELYLEDRDHNLGPALEALMRDSIIPCQSNRPKR